MLTSDPGECRDATDIVTLKSVSHPTNQSDGQSADRRV